jgi:hypothetical protein
VPDDAYAGRPLVAKLGVKEGSRAGLLGLGDGAFVRQLEDAGASVSTGRRRKNLDLLFLAVEDLAGLGELRRVEPLIARNGAVWVVYPKGRKDLRETEVIRAGVAAGLVDNKVVRFSDSHTALRFVIPVTRR